MTGNEEQRSHYARVAVPSDQTGRRTFLTRFLTVGVGLVGIKSLQFKNIDLGTEHVCFPAGPFRKPCSRCISRSDLHNRLIRISKGQEVL